MADVIANHTDVIGPKRSTRLQKRVMRPAALPWARARPLESSKTLYTRTKNGEVHGAVVSRM